MRYATAAAFRQALDQRLKNEAARTGLALVRLRKRVAFELFLRRLVQVAPDRWVLKGALALDLRLDARGRFTRDIDLGRDDDEQTAIEDITAAEQLQLDDFFSFSMRRDSGFADTDEFSAIRFHVTAQLAGRTFEQFVIDVGFTDAISWTPDTIETSGLLSFAGIEPVEIPAIPVAVHLAEKLHAYTRTYEGDRASTRPKDLVDILLIATSEPVEAGDLRTALDRTFTGRSRQQLPAALPPPPENWNDHYPELAVEVAVEPDLGRAFELAGQFLDPVLAGESNQRWDPGSWRWE